MKIAARTKLWMKLVALGVLLAASSCGGDGASDDDDEEEHDPFDDAGPEPIPNLEPLLPPTSLLCPNGSALTYDNFGESFMLNYCTMCHSRHLAGDARGGAPVESDFDTPQDVALWRTAIQMHTTGEAPSMPPANNVPPAVRAQLSEWLDCGAPGGTARIK